MRFSKSLLLAAAAQGAVAEISAYWGDGGYYPPDGNLAQWCADNEHIDILILAFLNTFGSGQYPQGSLGSCTVNSDGSSSGCDQLSSDIGTCQAAGKKVFVSLGGGGGSPALNSDNDATGVAYSLWNSWGNPDYVASGTPRPLGDITIDGWDIDIESDANNEDQNGYLATMINSLRSRSQADPTRTYYISGAPQCVIPDANMGDSIMNAQYDYLWIQFYNNYCSAGDVIRDSNNNPNGAGSFNLDQWPSYISGGASANAKLLVGIPGNTGEATSFDYIPMADVPQVYNAAKDVAGFAGFMVYEVGDTKSDGTHNGCDYFQNLYNVLTTGSAC